MTARDTREVVDLEVDLDQPLVCEADGCDREATWRCTAVHGSACDSAVFCEAHTKRYQVALILYRGEWLACARHIRPATVRWEPLT